MEIEALADIIKDVTHSPEQGASDDIIPCLLDALVREVVGIDTSTQHLHPLMVSSMRKEALDDLARLGIAVTMILGDDSDLYLSFRNEETKVYLNRRLMSGLTDEDVLMCLLHTRNSVVH